MKKYTYKEAAEALNYTYAHVTKLVKSGKLGRIINDEYQITQADIDNWKANRPKATGRIARLPDGKTCQQLMEKGMKAKEIALVYNVKPGSVFQRTARWKKSND